MSGEQTFRVKFCERFKVADADFREVVFYKSAHLHLYPLLPFIQLLAPHYFDTEHDLIDSLGECTSVRDIRGEADAYIWECMNSGYARKSLRLRLSTKRLIRIAKRVFKRKVAAAAPFA